MGYRYDQADSNQTKKSWLDKFIVSLLSDWELPFKLNQSILKYKALKLLNNHNKYWMNYDFHVQNSLKIRQEKNVKEDR